MQTPALLRLDQKSLTASLFGSVTNQLGHRSGGRQNPCPAIVLGERPKLLPRLSVLVIVAGVMSESPDTDAAAPSGCMEIRIPADTPEVDLPAYLLATIGAPPERVLDARWRETVAAYRREIRLLKAVNDGAGSTTKVEFELSDLPLGDSVREARLGSARRAIEVAMGAAHASMASVVNLHLTQGSKDLRLSPEAYRRPGTRTAQIDRTMIKEEELRAFMEREGLPLPDRRMPELTASSAPKNFLSRVVAPARPVLHLAIGLAQVVERAEHGLLDEYETRDRWEALGLGTYEIGLPDDGVRYQPKLNEMHLLGLPELSREAIALAEDLRPAVEAFLRSGRAPTPTMIRLLA